MRKNTRTAIYFSLVVALLFIPMQHASAAGCGEALFSQMKAAWAIEAKLVNQLKATGDCALVPKIMAAGNRAMAVCEQRAAQFSYCGAYCTRHRTAAQVEKELRAQCKTQAATKKTGGPANCITPPSPTTSRSSPTYACFKATNTNTDSRCIYSFTYTLTGKGSQAGGNVAPGESEERCSQQQGVDIAFEKWTKSGISAR